MANIKLPQLVRNARLDAVLVALGDAAYIELYTGTQPLIAGEPTSTIKLATLGLSPVPGVIANGVLTFNPITRDVSADDSGIVNWGRMLDGSGVTIMDFDCGTTASVAVLKFTSVLFAQGDIVEIQSFALTEGNE